MLLASVALTVVTPAWVDDRGADLPDWTDTDETDEVWWGWQPVSAQESTDMGRQGVITLRKAFGPMDTVMTAYCRAVIGGVTYEVVSVQPWDSITGGLAHSEAVFERVDG